MWVSLTASPRSARRHRSWFTPYLFDIGYEVGDESIHRREGVEFLFASDMPVIAFAALIVISDHPMI
jgi:hypothetical protein